MIDKKSPQKLSPRVSSLTNYNPLATDKINQKKFEIEVENVQF